jgi:predicted cupin superfamily sugar epimerase
MSRVENLVEKLGLQPHPEGGFYRETYRSGGKIRLNGELDIKGERNYSTAIYFLLVRDSFSAWHRIKQDEAWHFYEGAPVRVHSISPEGKYKYFDLGPDFDAGQEPQYMVPGGYWFASETLGDYSLVGCTVAPGFDFADFELAKLNELSELFPSHQPLIQKFTRE